MKALIGAALKFEEKQGIRTRKRRPIDQRQFEEQIEALICDVTYTLLYVPKGRTGHVCLSLSKQRIGPKQGGHRLINSVLGNTLTLLSMDGIGALEVSKGSINTGLQTTLKASKNLLSSIKQFGLTTDDFRIIKEDPLVQLRVKNPQAKRARLQVLNQADPEVARMTAELREINHFLQNAAIEYHLIDPKIDERNRRIYRVFNQSLSRNGIAYGGFWAGIGKKQRLEYLYIDDEPCIEIDLKSAVLQIAYALVGQINYTDFYDIPELAALGREKVKRYVLTYLYGGKEAFSRPLPKGIYHLLCSYEGEPNDRVLSRLLTLIKEHHKTVSHYFNPAGAGELTHALGEIMVLTVLRLTRVGVVALPVGDAIYVKESAEDFARQVFQECFNLVTDNQNLRTTATES